MDTSITVQVTEQGMMIPRTVIASWGEVELIQTDEFIIIRPRIPAPGRDRALAIQALREDGLLYESEGETDLPIILDEERTELARQLSSDHPLSESVMKGRGEHI